MNKCPYCSSNNYVGGSTPIVSDSDKWDIEQLAICLDCKKEFIFTYVEHKSLPIEDSTQFTPSETFGQ